MNQSIDEKLKHMTFEEKEREVNRIIEGWIRLDKFFRKCHMLMDTKSPEKIGYFYHLLNPVEAYTRARKNNPGAFSNFPHEGSDEKTYAKFKDRKPFIKAISANCK